MEWVGFIALALVLCYSSYPSKVNHLEAIVKRLERKQRGENAMSKLINELMNIQIFGTKKSFDTKKAERYFKERGIESLIDINCKDKDLLSLIQYIAEEDKAEKILENQNVIRTPIVRNRKQATVGYQPEVWKNWK
ncbi:arsenate reductase family protein [Faecalimonas sp.]